MPILDHFGILAPYYENFIHLKDPQKIINAARLPVKGAILDAGGGTGRVTQAFSGMASQLFVADVSIKMLLQASAKHGLLPVCSYSEKLPFPDNYFARVIMVDALHHVNNQTDTISEMWRVLKPGGLIVIEEPDIRNFSVKMVAIAERIGLMRSKFLSPERIKSFFHYPQAKSHIVKEKPNAWIIVEKSNN
jgi:ubiquinone/menaquinone biosynthesis C-methylase UbiE